MENKVLVTLYVPLIEKKYEVFLPASSRIGEIVRLLGKALLDINSGEYQLRGDEQLYQRTNGAKYAKDQLLRDTNIRNGTQLVYI